MASLTENLNALSLVPNSVRFGRGGKAKGFARGGATGGGGGVTKNNEDAGGRGMGSSNTNNMEMDCGAQIARHHDGPIIVGRGRCRGSMRPFSRGRRGFTGF